MVAIKEARTNTLTIPESEFSSDYVACLIFYIYSGGTCHDSLT